MSPYINRKAISHFAYKLFVSNVVNTRITLVLSPAKG